jgi:kynurenine 3-monooxygenase
MSLQNYEEMRNEVLVPRFQRQQTLSLELERRHPRRFIPRYAMVMFHAEIPYSMAMSRGRIQQQILDELVPDDAPGDLARADQLVVERLSPLT